LARIYAENASSPRIEDYFDDVYSFFENCYALKDWLKNDQEFSRKTDDEVERFVSQNPDLALCADIANGKKHLHLNRPPRSGAEPSRLSGHVIIDMTDTLSPTDDLPVKMKVQIFVDHAGKTLDVLPLATRCVEAWENFLR
jgi:hypothetical protein